MVLRAGVLAVLALCSCGADPEDFNPYVDPCPRQIDCGSTCCPTTTYCGEGACIDTNFVQCTNSSGQALNEECPSQKGCAPDGALCNP